MTHPPIDFSALRCAPVLEGGDGGALLRREVVRTLPNGRHVAIGEVADVLVVPDLRLQLVGRDIVPSEVVTQGWELDFEVRRDFLGKAAAYRSAFEIDESDLAVACLSNLYSRNFTHWILEELIRVSVLEASGFSGHYLVNRLPGFAYQFLELLGIPEGRIIRSLDRPTRFRSAAFVTTMDGEVAFDYGEVYHDLRRRLLDVCRPAARGGRERIWLTRGVGVNNGRELVNTEEVQRMLDQYGFRSVDMAAHPVAEQVRLANSAHILAGVHGSGHTNAFFMEPQSGVVECYSPLYINPHAFDLCRILRHDYSMLVHWKAYDLELPGGPNGVVVDMRHLELVLQRLCAEPPTTRIVRHPPDAPLQPVADDPRVVELRARLKAEEPVWGGLPAALRFKQDLVRAVGVEAAHAPAREALDLPFAGRLRRRPVRSMAEAARHAAREFRLLWEGGMPFSSPPMHVIGPHEPGSLHGVSRSAYLACFEDCLVRGRSSLVLHGEDALHDFERDENRVAAENPEYDTAILHAEGGSFWTMEPEPGDAVRRIPEAFKLSCSRAVDFGHWVTEYFPKLALARMAGLPPVPLILDSAIPSTVVAALEALWPGAGGPIVIDRGEALRVDRLWVASNPMYIPYYPLVMTPETWLAQATPPQGFATLVAEVVRMARLDEVETPAAERLFLARKPTLRKKPLLNHAEVETIARRHGFTLVYPEDHPFRTQLALVQRARRILGPEGSNMLLALYAAPGAEVCCLNPPHILPLADIAGALAAAGVGLTVLTGPANPAGADPEWPFWDPYTIPPEVLDDFLARWARD